MWFLSSFSTVAVAAVAGGGGGGIVIIVGELAWWYDALPLSVVSNSNLYDNIAHFECTQAFANLFLFPSVHSRSFDLFVYVRMRFSSIPISFFLYHLAP